MFGRFVALSRLGNGSGGYPCVRPTILARLLFLLLSAGTLRAAADRGLEHARRAQALLGSDRWSRIVRVENSDRHGPYPRVVYGVVFELVGILWFYTDTDGTQSFSLHPGKLEEEKSAFGPLLRGIDRGFGRWTILPDVPATDPAWLASRAGGAEVGDAKDREAALPNGCFIESLAKLRQLLRAGVKVTQPMLLSFYAEHITQGHTVLVYGTQRSLVVYDATSPGKPVEVPLAGVINARDFARAISRAAVQRGLFLPLDRAYAPTQLLIPEIARDTRITANTPRGPKPRQSG